MLASVALALGVYQLALIAVAYGKVRLPFLDPPPAGRTHRAVGDTIVVLVVVVALICVSYFGFEDDASLHVASADRTARRARRQGLRRALVARARPDAAGARDQRLGAARADLAHLGRRLPGGLLMDRGSHAVQMLGSLLVALVIAAATVAVVTAKLGPTSAAEREALEDRIDLREERLKERQDRLEERQKQREEDGG